MPGSFQRAEQKMANEAEIGPKPKLGVLLDLSLWGGEDSLDPGRPVYTRQEFQELEERAATAIAAIEGGAI